MNNTFHVVQLANYSVCNNAIAKTGLYILCIHALRKDTSKPLSLRRKNKQNKKKHANIYMYCYCCILFAYVRIVTILPKELCKYDCILLSARTIEISPQKLRIFCSQNEWRKFHPFKKYFYNKLIADEEELLRKLYTC